MKRYGLAYEDLKPLNEKLIMLSISGFGQQGPESTKPHTPLSSTPSQVGYSAARTGTSSLLVTSTSLLPIPMRLCMELSGYSPLLEWLSSPDRDST